ncbi:DEAD/DEAH box helicase [Kushneria phosphatilytica]|uniref:DEAD-box ATP-dependent RNA helicase RhpA n=1 Tax=Kushneria phosphatilytica TaxID=657387 RepID=A0A1S1NX54_9GAMM|nr:DEAD/DEAH box helicase [Kushneria phosphatilytica]OHV12836.1 RNA helicase [Kushneria phosphatilytica]QEL10684.1 DEAD/DEAH box helicase [Kushneria phosphatilytica]
MTSTSAASPNFGDMALLPAVLESLDALGYETPSPIQARTIPSLLEGRDLLGQAQTGTGKTAAFALPLLSRLELDRREVQVLVLAPTRELAQQVAVAFGRYGQNLKGLEVVTLCGGQDYREQLRGLKRGGQVVVGTPGRVIDHLDRGSLTLEGLNAMVLDEADEMLRMGFIDDVKRVLEDTPTDAQRVFFSATLPPEITRIVSRFLVEPETVQIETKAATTTIEQRLCRVEGPAKTEALARILEVEPVDAAIVFVRTRAACTTLVDQLTARGVAAAALSGDLDQSLRERTVMRLKKGKVDVLVATDVAARGLDVPRITHVINYDMPHDNEAYIHRIGRTGRAGREGVAITFAGGREARRVRWLEQATGQRIENMELPDENAIRSHRAERFKARAAEALERGADDQRELVESLIEQGFDPVDLACVFASMARADEPAIQAMPKPGRGNDRDRGERGNRDGKPQRRRATPPAEGMTRYRVAVGHNEGVKPGQLVGALANEGGIEGARIGRIDIRQSHSLVDLPSSLPSSILAKMARARVGGRTLDISEDQGRPERRRGEAPERRQRAS